MPLPARSHDRAPTGTSEECSPQLRPRRRQSKYDYAISPAKGKRKVARHVNHKDTNSAGPFPQVADAFGKLVEDLAAQFFWDGAVQETFDGAVDGGLELVDGGGFEDPGGKHDRTTKLVMATVIGLARGGAAASGAVEGAVSAELQ